MEPAAKWMRPSDLAEKAGVSRRTIWRWQEKGLVESKRRAPRVGVRMRLIEDDADDD
jgi:DNA-binding transcriptional MerR regulator